MRTFVSFADAVRARPEIMATKPRDGQGSQVMSCNWRTPYALTFPFPSRRSYCRAHSRCIRLMRNLLFHTFKTLHSWPEGHASKTHQLLVKLFLIPVTIYGLDTYRSQASKIIAKSSFFFCFLVFCATGILCVTKHMMKGVLL